MSLYSRRGVSAQKEEVHQATARLDKGLYPFAFCKIYEDYLGKDANWVNIMHADGAGTKSIWLICTGKKPVIFPFGGE